MAASSDVMRGALGVSLTAALREKAPDYAYRFRYQSVRADGLGTCGVTPCTDASSGVVLSTDGHIQAPARARYDRADQPSLFRLHLSRVPANVSVPVRDSFNALEDPRMVWRVIHVMAIRSSFSDTRVKSRLPMRVRGPITHLPPVELGERLSSGVVHRPVRIRTQVDLMVGIDMQPVRFRLFYHPTERNIR